MDELTVYKKVYETVKEWLETDEPDVTYLRGMFGGWSAMIEMFSVPMPEPPKSEVFAEPEPSKKIPKQSGKGGKREPITETEKYRMRALFDTGLNLHEIADKTRRSYPAVSKVLYGYTPRKTTTPGKGTIDWIRELAASGMGVEDIAERVGYTTSIIIKYAGKGE